MILLRDTDKLEIVLAGAITTSQAVLYAAFADMAEDASSFAPGASNGLTNGTTAVDWVSAPAADLVRQIKYLSLYNNDTASITATVRIDDGTNERILTKFTLSAGERAAYVDGAGFQVFDATGAPKGSAVSSVNGEYGSVRTPCDFIVAISDETTNITTGTAKITFRATRAMTITSIVATLATASSSGNPAFDVNKNGSSVFSTTVTIDSGEKTSATAATPAVISGGSFVMAAGDEITVDVDTAGTGAKGAKIAFIGTY